MLRIRRFYYGVFLLAAMPVAYFIFHVHNEATPRVKFPSSGQYNLKSKEERIIHLVHMASKFNSELPLKPHDQNYTRSSVNKEEAELTSTTGTGKHLQLFKEFSSAIPVIDMDRISNRTQDVGSKIVLKLNPSHRIRVPQSRKTIAFPLKYRDKDLDIDLDLYKAKTTTAVGALGPRHELKTRNEVLLAKTNETPDLDSKVPNVTTENPYMIKMKIKADVIKNEPVPPTRSRAWRTKKDSSSRLGRERGFQEYPAASLGHAREPVTTDYHFDAGQNSRRNVRIVSRPSSNLPVEKQRRNTSSAAISTTVSLPYPEGTTRSKTCNACFQLRISYVINPKHVCQHAGDRILVLIIVFSEHSHRDKRTVIRETWGSVTNKNVGVVRLVFLLGDIDDEYENLETRRESARYGDILLGDFEESFRNLTLKTVMGLGWATRFCTRAKYLMKTDDDMWVNIPMFLIIEQNFELEKVVAGTCWLERWEPHRNEDDKYHVSEAEYPQKFFPELCVGTAYVMTLQTASDIYRVHPNIPFFHLEDVYVALCREYLGYGVVPLPGFSNKKEPFSVCYYRTQLVTSHWVGEAELREAWTKVCFLAPKDPIVEFFNKYPPLSPKHPRHHIGRQR
ncbi:beta-1,3-galactosyltransferase 2-like [Lineus longissimus]|uniref:beta-1,3-galactosyltransferase 2-like n=1 Tax=Lineus longissimus TaxID=88925 RepID=UPI002B4C9774